MFPIIMRSGMSCELSFPSYFCPSRATIEAARPFNEVKYFWDLSHNICDPDRVTLTPNS